MTSTEPSKRHVPHLGFGLFVATIVVAQLFPLLNVLGYELSVLTGIALTVLAGPRFWRVFDEREAHRAALHVAGRLGLWILAATAISLLNALRVRNCDLPGGLLYMALFGLGAIPMATALTATVARATRGRWRWGLHIGLLLTSLGATLYTLAIQPAIVAYDTFFGYFAGSIYDESLVAIGPHVVYRVWGLAWAIGLLALLRIAERPTGVRPTRRAAVVALAAFSVALALQARRGDLGLLRTESYVMTALGGALETEHFIIYYDAERTDDAMLRELAYDHEARYAELTTFWGREPGYRLRSFVYPDHERRGELMGGRRTLVAKIWRGQMHITWDGVGDELLAHEMSHLFLRESGSGPLRLSSRAGLIPDMALLEGSATAAAWGADELTYHGWAAALYALDLAPDLSTILQARAFWSLNGSVAYTLVGSFSRWLIETHGPDAYLEGYALGHIEAGYDTSLETLVGQWRAYLDTIPLDDAALATAEYRFDRPTIFGRQCARAIATEFDRGGRLLTRRDHEGAARCFEGILHDDPTNLQYRLEIAGAFRRMGDGARAEALAEEIAAHEGAGIVQRARAQRLLGDLAWDAGRSGDALTQFQQILEAPLSPGFRRQIEARVQALEPSNTPLTREAVRRYLVSTEPPESTTQLAELIAAWEQEGRGVAAYLVGLRLAQDPQARLVRDYLDAAIATGELSEGQLTQARRARAIHAARAGAADACALWAAVAEDYPETLAIRAEAEMWLGRCARGDLPGAGRDL